jgi:hypothetical protein
MTRSALMASMRSRRLCSSSRPGKPLNETISDLLKNAWGSASAS